MAKGMVSKKDALAGITEEIRATKQDRTEDLLTPMGLTKVEMAEYKHFLEGLQAAKTIIKNLPSA